MLALAAFTVVAGTLVLQGLSLPWLVRRLKLPSPDAAEDALQSAQLVNAAANAGLAVLDEVSTDDDPAEVLTDLRDRAMSRSNRIWEQLGRSQDEIEPPSAAYRRLRLQMLSAERSSILEARDRGVYDDEVLRHSLQAIDLEESLLDRIERRRCPAGQRARHGRATGPGTASTCRTRPGSCGPTRRTAARSACATALRWVHLRLCLECGHVGCCDSSPGRHAVGHHEEIRAPGHALDRTGRGLALVFRGRPARLSRRTRHVLDVMSVMPLYHPVGERLGTDLTHRLHRSATCASPSRRGAAAVARPDCRRPAPSPSSGCTARRAPPSTHHPSAHAPIVFGHRGAAGYRPEHTASGYRLAAQLGADFLEPDLVPTKDGYLVDRHEPDISQTTDVASHPEFASLRTTKTVDGVKTTGWFTTDFTLAQLETLRAVERIPDIRQHNTLYNGVDRIPTLQDDIRQFEALAKEYHRTIGIVPEIKHSTFFRFDRVADGELASSAVLHHYGLDGKHPALPTIIQSFEVGNLRYLHRVTRIPLLQLTSATGAPADFVASGNPRTYADITSAAGLKQVAKYATYLGPDKNQIVPRTTSNALGAPTTLIRDAHRVGLLVAPYTFRNENSFLPTDYQRGTNPADYGDALAEYRLFYSLGVDGVFSDDSDTAIAARDQWIAAGRPHLR